MSKPPQNKKYIWDVDTLIDWLGKEKIDEKSMFQVSRWVALILLLASGRRIHDFTLLDISEQNCVISEKAITFWPLFGSKPDKFSHRQSGWKLLSNSERSIDAVYWINCLIRVSRRRKGSLEHSSLFITKRGKIGKASRSITAGWVRTAFLEAGIVNNDIFIDFILRNGNWTNNANLFRYYYREINRSYPKLPKTLTEGFQLRKWRSNRLEAIQDFSNDSKPIEFSLNKEQEAKTLGLTWNSELTCFSEKVTKRTILSKVASIFDPLGLLAPCIILAKILLQKLWVEDLSWDESLPSSLHAYWLEFSSKLDSLNASNIPRKVTCKQANYIEIHGFADASIQAYGGCVYIKSVNSSICSVELLCAKSKVAPLKTLKTPRLELCAALTLARLISKVLESADVKFERIVCWSDSTIVLGWLKTPPNLLKSFVDNRVAKIQKITESFEWRHVPTHDNPADLLSRDVKLENVFEMQLWWQGPAWLQDDEENWPTVHYSNPTQLPELRKTFKVTLDVTFFPFDRFSNINRLKRSFANVIKFKNNCLRARSERIKSELTNSVIDHAFQTLVRFTQMLCFPNEYRDVDRSLSKFWDLEEYSKTKPITIDEQKAEGIFCETTTRDSEGRFVVRIPFKHSPDILALYKDISCILKSASLSLDKWISNDNNIMETITVDQPNVIVNISDNEQTDSLGLLWHSATDNLQYDIKPYNPPSRLTKRHILSTVAKIYDPLGLVGPVIVKAKILLHVIWQLKYDWDLPLPKNIAEQWHNLTEQLHTLSQLKIPDSST
nr:unnamed protein product [Callosobruchus chinensis]